MVGRKHNGTKLMVTFKTNMMKQLIKYIMLLAAPVLFVTGCKKDTTANLSKEVKVSFPVITLNGTPVVIVAKNAAYTDAGAKLKDDITGAITDIQPSANPVNTAQPGVYTVTYSASNANGFETTAERVVIVKGTAGTINRQGTYLRTATGLNCIITKIDDGVYSLKNPGGSPASPNTIVYMVETAPNVYICPAQPSDQGTFSVININFTATGVTWNVVNPGFGTATRTFVKQ
jgi:Domain of unknown function (DUF5011)